MFRHYASMMRMGGYFFGLVLLAFTLVSCGGTSVTGSATPTPTSTPTSGALSTQSPLPTLTNKFKLSDVNMSVSPASIAGRACGTSLTVTYTATFIVAPGGSSGGIVQFVYSSNNGRGTTPAVLILTPDETSKTYSFTATGTLSPDNVFPGLGGVVVTSPNSLIATPVKPAGVCSGGSSPSAFKVTSIDLATSPSLNGHKCGTSFTENYTATFHLASNGPGGTIAFFYTTNNGRSQQKASLNAAAGQTSATYTFTWSGTLSADHVEPGAGGIITSSPNVANSPFVSPNGACS